MVFPIIMYVAAILLLFVSYKKDSRKTVLALKKAGNIFINLLPQFLAILLLIGMVLAFLNPKTIEAVIGSRSGFGGMILSALTCSFTIIPVLIAFPIAVELLKNGAGLMQIAVFISTLTTVGLVTIPLEAKYLGIKVSLFRNGVFFIFSFISAWLIGMVVS